MANVFLVMYHMVHMCTCNFLFVMKLVAMSQIHSGQLFQNSWSWKGVRKPDFWNETNSWTKESRYLISFHTANIFDLYTQNVLTFGGFDSPSTIYVLCTRTLFLVPAFRLFLFSSTWAFEEKDWNVNRENTFSQGERGTGKEGWTFQDVIWY